MDQLAAVFTIDAVEMKFSAMAAAAKASDSADLHQSVAMAALPLLDDAVAADNFDLAQRIAALAESSAPRSKKIALTSMVGDRVKEMKAVREERRAGAESLKRIAANEGSADDYLVAGRFLCFAKGDWTAGLPMLYRCPDVTFKAPAARELAGPADAAGWFALAGDWWDLAAKQNSPAAVRVQQHAAACYAKALPGLAGVNRALAEKRIDEVEIALLKSRRFEPGLVAELYRGTDFDTRVLTRIDPQLDFDWGREPPADGMPRSDYSARWRGRLRVPAAGSYTLILITGAGRLVLDGKELVNSDVLYRKRNGVQFELDLSAGLHELTLEIHVKSGQGRARLLWLRPGVVENEVIPVEAFFHSALDASAPPTTSPARTP